MRVCIIPARGGSKRVPRKNVRPFGGLPMIAHPIHAAASSGCFDRILVSTDDAEIAKIAKQAGAEVPFVRPPELSDDHATSIAVIEHATRWLAQNGPQPSHVCCLYATAPFVTPEHLRQAYDLLIYSGANYCFPVTTFAFPPQRALRRLENGGVTMLEPAHELTRSQDLVEAVHDAGAFYWGTYEAWMGGISIYGPGSTTIILPRHLVQDIDTEEDWSFAEILYRCLRQTEEKQ